MSPLPLLLAMIGVLFPFLPSTIATTPTAEPILNSPTLTLQVPAHIPALPPSTRAILISKNLTLKAPIRRDNTFVFDDLTRPLQSTSKKEKVSYLLDIACKDYDFASYGIDVYGSGKMEMFGVGRGAVEIGGRAEVGDRPVGLRVLKGREYYEARQGFSPLSLLKNPMILIAVVGLGFVFGMPYLMDSMDPEMKQEFEEQQKKSILSGGAATPNPLQNFDMAAWMAGKTAGKTAEGTEVEKTEGSASASGAGGGSGGPKARRRRG